MLEKLIQHTTITLIIAFSALILPVTHANAADEPSDTIEPYKIQPGDVLLISAWKDEDLTHEILVRPDGQISFPLAGEVLAAGDSIENLRVRITEKLQKYIPDPVLSVSVTRLLGNKVYVIGKVNRPGEFAMARKVDVIQALSMAGGTSTYAALNKIKILRREEGALSAIGFKYGEVEKGENLEQNIILKAGDVVIVP